MSTVYRIFPTALDLAERVALDLADKIRSAERDNSPIALALSGGNTPRLLFAVLAEKYHSSLNWSFVHFFWADERCVLPDNHGSNYGMTYRLLLEKIDIPMGNIHRMRGENDPGSEANRYSEEILENIRLRNGLPVFDIILLGMGEDGHTASIFPGNIESFNSTRICEQAIHPVSGQKRVSLTGKVINNADEIIFLVTGKNKADIVHQIITRKEAYLRYPAANIYSEHGKTTWLLDKEAGRYLELL
jgi:6-phosphogluconolactonase